MSESELARLIQQDDSLYAFIRCRLTARLRSQLDVEDILQEVFVAAQGVLHVYQDRDEKLIRSWLKGVALHRIISAVRTRRSHPCMNEGELQPHEHGAETMRAPQRTPSSTVAATEGRERVIAALHDLPARQKNVVQLYALQGQNPAIVARRLQIKRDSVHSHMSVAKDNLRILLGSGKCI